MGTLYTDNRYIITMALKLAALVVVAPHTCSVVSRASEEYKSNKLPALEAGQGWTRCYLGRGQGGGYREFQSYVSDLSQYGYDNQISSTCSTGVWIYYDYHSYNTNQAGQVLWFHGIQYCGDMSSSFDNKASSIRYAGSSTALDQSSFTLFDGQGFMGAEFFGSSSVSDLRQLAAKGESLIVTGTSQWTFYTGENYSGQSVCAGYKTTDSSGGQTMHIGLYPKLNSVYTNTIRSVRQGCHSNDFVELVPLKATHEAENGAMGSFFLEDL